MCNALAKSKLGGVGAREGQITGRATVQGLGGKVKTELVLAYAHAFAWDYPGVVRLKKIRNVVSRMLSRKLISNTAQKLRHDFHR